MDTVERWHQAGGSHRDGLATLGMGTEIRIPKIGMSATEMTLTEWMFGDGEDVAKGDIIYTLETDKTTVEIEAQADGTLRILGADGEIYPVGALVGTIE